jgi:hypothetical protein
MWNASAWVATLILLELRSTKASHELKQLVTQGLIRALVISRLDYCNYLLAGLPAFAIKPLQLIQNAAAHLFFNLLQIKVALVLLARTLLLASLLRTNSLTTTEMWSSHTGILR